MSDANNNLKQRVRDFWETHPCGSKFTAAEFGTKDFFELIEIHRYESERHIPVAADFASSQGKQVLEIGCGIGTDGVQFAKAGAVYTGVDLTTAAIDLAKKNFELRGLEGKFQTADAEKLEFADSAFDVVYSHGVLHHTPDTKKAISEVHRVLRPGGKAIVMLYHRNSYNHAVNIRLFRRVGAYMLKWNSGVRAVHSLTGEPLSSLKEHAARLRNDRQHYFEQQEFLNNNTDGIGNPLARVYSRREALELFRDFARVRLQTYFLNKRFIPVAGKVLPLALEDRLASRWGWHLWVYAEK